MSLCSCKTARLAPELQVSMGSSPYLWFLHAKQRDLHQNDKSIWVQAIICSFVHEKQRLWTSNTSLYGSQTSSVVFSTHNRVCSTRLSRPYGFQPSTVVLCMQNRDFWTRITGLCVSKTPPVLFACKTATSGSE